MALRSIHGLDLEKLETNPTASLGEPETNSMTNTEKQETNPTANPEKLEINPTASLDGAKLPTRSLQVEELRSNPQ